MRRIAHLGIALVGFTSAIPAFGGDDPMIPPKPEGPLPHSTKHLGGRPSRFCAICQQEAKAKAATKTHHHTHQHARPTTGPRVVAAPPSPMPPGTTIVGCMHSANGVCPTCRKLLEMPGEVTMVSQGAPSASLPMGAMAAAPGRAVATDATPGTALVGGEPEPIGVMRTNYRAATPGMPAPMAAQPSMPASAGQTPFLPPQPESEPRILEHLFGFSAMKRDVQDKMMERSKRKRESHAAIPYGPESAQKVEELPASVVYGKGPR